MDKKNKTTQYVLLLAVLAIWGYVIFKLVDMRGGGDESYVANTVYLPISVDSSSVEKDTFAINADYRDPFLGNPSKTKSKTSKKSSKGKYQRKAPPIPSSTKRATFPKVKYYAFSINENSITRVRIGIGDKSFTMKPGQIEDKVQLIAMYRDSIIVSFGNRDKTVMRAK